MEKKPFDSNVNLSKEAREILKDNELAFKIVEAVAAKKNQLRNGETVEVNPENGGRKVVIRIAEKNEERSFE